MTPVGNKTVWHIQRRLSDNLGRPVSVDGDLGGRSFWPKSETLNAAREVLGGPVAHPAKRGVPIVWDIQYRLNEKHNAGLALDGDLGGRHFWARSKTLAKLLDALGGPVELPKVSIRDRLSTMLRGNNITRIIVHCAATPEGRPITSASIGSWHKARGFSNRGGTYVGYHYLIHLDGTVEPCKPENVRGTHAYPWNTGSIGVCYIGGVAKDGKTPKDTRTPEQIAAMTKLLRELFEKYPGAKLFGHRDVPGVAKACPSFDVRAWWETV